MLALRIITKPDEIAYLLASAPLQATLADLVRIAGYRWKIEECFQNAKNECGPGQYEARRYTSWHRHTTLAMLAHAFLTVSAARAREKVPLWFSSSCSRCGWLVEGAVAEHGEEDVDAPSGECDEGGDVMFSLAPFAVVVGA